MRKWICRVLVLVLLSSVTACGKPSDASVGELDNEEEKSDAQTSEAKNYKEGVIDASELTIQNGVVFWGYDQQLCSALLDENDDMYDFISEGSLSTVIHSIAVDGDCMYMSTESGIVCMSLNDAEQEQSKLSVIDDHELSTSSFQIYDGNIYFTYGKNLIMIPEEGGEDKTLEQSIEAFQVTTEGIYCINTNGSLIRVSLDGSERKTLQELDSEGELFILNHKAYITTGGDDNYIYVYELDEGNVEKIHFEHNLSPYHPVWVTEECVYYESEDYEVFRYDFESETEFQIDVIYDLPDYQDGYLWNDTLYYVYSNYLYWMHLDSGESFKYSKSEVLEDESSLDVTFNAANAGSSEEAYNIAEDIGVYNSEGQARLESKYFTLYLPADGDWTYKVVDNSTIGIYYEPAYESGDGGHLVTIKAYDWGDNSYGELPSYKVAGVSDDKKYIAIFPTDVQFNSSQADGYNRMYEYVKRIDDSEGNAGSNPFSCQ